MTDALEVRLLRWGESSQAGRTVTFLLPEEGEHPFRGLKTGKEGELFAIALARIEDPKAKADHIYGGNDGYTDNSGPKDKTAPKSEGRSPGQKAVALAHVLCNDPAFQEWLCSMKACPVGPSMTAMLLRDLCDIASRADFAFNPAACEALYGIKTDFDHRDTVGR